MSDSSVDLTYRSGSVYLKGYPLPFMLVTKKFMADLQRDMARIMGESSAKALFYRVGYMGGSRGVRNLKEENPNLTEKDAVMAFINLFNRAAWGETELLSMSGEGIIVRISHSYGEEYGEIGRDVCYLIQGIFAGVLAEATGRKTRAEEVRCVGKGDPYCEIVVRFL